MLILPRAFSFDVTERFKGMVLHISFVFIVDGTERFKGMASLVLLLVH